MMRQRAPLLLTGISNRMCCELERESASLLDMDRLMILLLLRVRTADVDRGGGAKLLLLAIAAKKRMMLIFVMMLVGDGVAFYYDVWC